MFSGCKLGANVLLEILNSLPELSSISTITNNITIGYDSREVDPDSLVPLPGYGVTWKDLFSSLRYTVTWEAYVEPVANAPKLLKASKQKLYKLDEIAEEMLEMLGDSTVYVKDGKHYLMTSGDSVTAPGPNGETLHNTEIENVVYASSPSEALEKLGVVEMK